MSKQSEALREYFEKNGIRNKYIQEKLGLNNASLISNMLSGKDSIGAKRAHQLHDAFGFNVQFLLTGEGSLIDPPGLRRPSQEEARLILERDSEVRGDALLQIRELQATLQQKQTEIELLKRENDRLWKTIEALTSKS